MLKKLAFAALPVLALGVASPPAFALTMKECSTKYQAAKKANTLKGASWNDFRKAECADDDASDTDAAAAVAPEPAKPAAAAPAKPAATTAPAATTTAAAPAATPAKPAVPAPAAKPSAAIFPRTVATKYANETPGKARLKTCVDQYNANKAAGKNGDLKWIQEGGGYWSQCNSKLKAG
ncbi:hypothetical protein [Terrarubrum flagellatum]|uniref:hypothetical protein n=1 Tax=Terrirubrum flagellatum TaxID=2895980 RepID=UPI003144DDF8